MSRALIAGGGAVAAVLTVAGAVALGGGDGAPPAAAAPAAAGETGAVERRDLVERDTAGRHPRLRGRCRPRRGHGGHAHPPARPRQRGPAGRVALLRRRARRGVAPLRRPAGVARLRPGDGGRRRRPPARAQPARAGRRPRRRHDRRRRVGLGHDGRRGALPGGARAGRDRLADPRPGPVPRRPVADRRGDGGGGPAGAARGGRSAASPPPAARSPSTSTRPARGSPARATPSPSSSRTGASARGRVTDVGKVAEPAAEEGGDPTIPVTVALRGKGARGSGLDQAPVDVGFEVERAQGRADRPGQGAARAPGRRVRRRARRLRPDRRRSSRGSTPTTASRSRATCGRATPS